jgi:GTPase SAR1 family protein
VILFVYDVTDERSFEHVRHWLDRIQSAWIKDYSPMMMLVGNKTDREGRDRVVTREAGETFARRHDMMFCETSAKTGEGVEDAFLLPAYAFAKSHASVLEEAEAGLDLVTLDGEEGMRTISGCCWW